MKLLVGNVNYQQNRLPLILFLLLYFSISLTQEIPGCTNPEADNFNPEATAYDGSCIFSENPFEGGWNQSQYQAFYLFLSASIDEIDLEEGDWIGAYRDIDGDGWGDILVGAGGYGLDEFNDFPGWSTVPAMGEDPTPWTEGYLLDGETPVFKIWDASTGILHDAFAIVPPWEFNGVFFNFSVDVIHDCGDVLGGHAYIDDCDTCSGGTTGLVPNADLDCMDVCYGLAIVDDCGICSLGTSGHSPNVDLDCEGVCFGEAFEDVCGVCSGGTTEHEPNSDLDCAGVCFGDAIEESFWYDSDGDGLGAGDEYLLCTGIIPDNWVDNNLDEDDNCASNIHDCNGDCDGNAIIDDCGICGGANVDLDCEGVCFGSAFIDYCGVCSEGTTGHGAGSDDNGCGCFAPEAQTYYQDIDGDGLGYGDGLEFCGDEFPDSWVSNNDDAEPNCGTNDTDSCGICAGNNEDLDCNGTCFGSAIVDECGICGGIGDSCNSPTANNMNLTTGEDTSIEFTFDMNDPNGDVLSPQILIPPTYGEITVNGMSGIYTPDVGYIGFDNFTYLAFDGSWTSNSATVDIEIVLVNDPPLAVSEEYIMLEDEILNITLVGSDEETSELTFDIDTFPQNGILTEERAIALYTYVPFENYFGPDYFVYSVSDGEISTSAEITISVLPVNEPPLIFGQSHTILENGSISIEVSMIDYDGDNLEMNIISGPHHGTITGDVINGAFTYNAENGFYGEELIVVQARELDTEQNLTSDQSSIIISILPVNEAPVSQDLSIILMEDSQIEIDLIATDSDGDELEYIIDNYPLYGTLTGSGSVYTYSPSDNYNGTDSFTYFVSDGSENSITSQVLLEITPVNDTPTALSGEFEDVDQNGFVFVLNEFITDLDGDDLTIQFIPEIDGMGFSVFGGTIVPLGGNTFLYSSTTIFTEDYILYKAKDGQSESNVATITLYLSSGRETPDPSSPMAFSQTVDIMEDTPFGITLVGFDMSAMWPVDGSAFFTVFNGPSHGTLGEPILLTTVPGVLIQWFVPYTPNSDYSGNDSFDYTVHNPNNNSPESYPGEVSITVYEINDPPVISTINDFAMSEDETTILPISYSDPDNDLIFSSSSTNSDDISISFYNISDTTAEVIIAPHAHISGEFIITLTASESDGDLQDSETFTLTVNEVNDAPSMVPIDNKITNEDQTIEVSLFAEDVDGNVTFEFSVVITDGMDLVSGSIVGNVLTLTPEPNKSGLASISVTANDGIDSSAPVEFNLTIQSINDEPELEPIENPPLAYEDGSNINVYISPMDEDGENLNIEIISSNIALFPEGSINVDPVNPPAGSEVLISLDPADNMFGDDIIIVKVNDNISSVAQQFAVEVVSVNDPPNITPIEDYQINEDGVLIFDIYANDIEGDEIEYSISTGENFSVGLTGNTVQIIPEPDFTGVEEFNITVSDGVDASYDSFLVEVIPVNDPPIITSFPVVTAVEDQEYSYLVTVEDVDDAVFLYSLTNAPEGMEISDIGLINWIPTEGIYSSGSITVSVTDNGGEIATQIFNIIVTPVNDPPTIISTPPVDEISTGEVFTYQVEVDDPDDDQFNYILINAPSGMNTSNSGLITWTPEFSGTFGPITIVVSDGGEDGAEPDSQDFSVIVFTTDCYGTLNGSAYYDDCGECVGGETGLTENYAKDCAGVCFGIASIDDCGECTGGTIPLEHNYALDCNNDCFGFAFMDNCGVCSSGNTEHIANSDIDCNGDCAQDTPVSCEDENCGNAVIDFCGTCSEGATGIPINSEDLGCGCFAPDEIEYWVDEDADGLGAGDGSLYCPELGDIFTDDTIFDLVPPGWVNNNDDFCPLDNENDADSDEICGDVDICPYDDENDADNDNICGDIDICPYDAENDADNDDVCGDVDTCPGYDDNLDADTDAIPDDCDTCPQDAENDADNDTICGDIDICPYDADNDIDLDTVCGDVDNCPAISNESQWDYDLDGAGDACDTDDDNDDALDENDSDDNNEFICSDNDEDACDDCSSGTFNTSMDGPDDDADGICILSDVDLVLDDGNNLVSFYALPSDLSIPSIFNSMGSDIVAVIGEGVVSYHQENGSWIGSLGELSHPDGYWLKTGLETPEEPREFEVIGTPISPVTYTLHDGNNLVSYPYPFSQSLESALPDYVESELWGIVGEGVAATLIDGNWVGSLSIFEGGKGYWIVSNIDDLSFEYNSPPEGLPRNEITQNEIHQAPTPFNFVQSTRQAFYFIDNVTYNNNPIDLGDWIIAYRENVVVGARMWSGNHTDIPVMGYDEFSNTIGYCSEGDIPQFKLFRESTGELIQLFTNGTEPWTNIGIYTINEMSDEPLVPNSVSLGNAYPNPFNAFTSIEFGLSNDSFVTISIFDILGKRISLLVNNQFTAGFHTITWDASLHSTGVYFIQMHTEGQIQTKKILLVK